MKLSRLLLAGALLACLAGVAQVSQRTEGPGQKMANAAEQFLQSLKTEQKDKAVLPFDSKERVNWNFVPLEAKGKPTRKGLSLKEMTAEQKQAALALVAAGTSVKGHEQAVTIMSLESILRDLEKGRGPTRDPEWYFFTVFGSPSKDGKWGWRVEGHHLSLNFTLEGGKVTSATPFFFGANPAELKAGAKKGTRTLPEAEDLALALFNALDEDQKKAAYRGKAFPEPRAKSADPGVGEPVGLAAAKMNDKQRGTLMQLVESYSQRMPPEVAQEEMARLRQAGTDKLP